MLSGNKKRQDGFRNRGDRPGNRNFRREIPRDATAGKRKTGVRKQEQAAFSRFGQAPGLSRVSRHILYGRQGDVSEKKDFAGVGAGTEGCRNRPESDKRKNIGRSIRYRYHFHGLSGLLYFP